MANFKDPIDNKSLLLLAVSLSILLILIASAARQALEVGRPTEIKVGSAQRTANVAQLENKNTTTNIVAATISRQPTWAVDPQSLSYQLDGHQVTFQQGQYELQIPGSASKYSYRFTGSSLEADLNKDGKPDAVGMVVEQGPGSGTFFYIVAAISQGDTLVPLPAYLVGDRIQPVVLYTKDDAIGFRYLDRSKDQPLSSAPTIEKKLVLEFKDGKLSKYR